MRHPTTTLTIKAATVTLETAYGYNVLLEENGDPLLTEDGLPLVGEAFAAPVTLASKCPTVALELRRNA